MNIFIIILVIAILTPLFYYLIINLEIRNFFRDVLNKLLGIQKVVDEELGTKEDVYEGDMCIFLDSDLYNDRIFTDENQPITANLIERNEKENIKRQGIKLNSGKHFTVKCDECKKYIYKNEDDNCSPYTYDRRYTASNSLGVCTSIGYSKPCDQVAKILQ